MLPLLVGAICVSLTLTWAMRHYALTRRLIDVPNERSSHANPTPRGGGVAIVVTFMGLLPLLWADGTLQTETFVALGGAGALIAIVGFWDDHRPVPAKWRLTAHFIGAAWLVAWCGGLPPVFLAGVTVLPSWSTSVIAAIYVVWLLNLYNFMDGIDGLASIEAMTVCVGAVLLYQIAVPGNPSWAGPALLTACVAGFGFWNWSPARIFMGDAGSGFLGVTLGGFSIQAAGVSADLFYAWAILLGVFITDATVTLIRRLWRGHRYDQAHRTHAYQHAARRLASHARVSLLVGGINLAWLWPLALLVAVGRLDAILGLAIAYTPLLGLALWLGAGTPSREP